MSSAPPIHEIRLGSIKANIWQNEGQQGLNYRVTVCRIYKEGEEWKQTRNFRREDLPLVNKVLDRVHSYLYDQLA